MIELTFAAIAARKGTSSLLSSSLRSSGTTGKRNMRIDAHVTVARKMFRCGECAIFFDAADELSDVFGNLLWNFAE